jgi:hypothetical protein
MDGTKPEAALPVWAAPNGGGGQAVDSSTNPGGA